MSRNIQLKKDWEKLNKVLAKQFGKGETLELNAIIYLIGVQELGKGKQLYKKEDKINLIHIAICKLLEPFGYYSFSHFDEDGWPHYTMVEELPALKSGEQTVLMKEAIVLYFKELGFI